METAQDAYYVPQNDVPQGYGPQGYAPQGYAPQGYGPQGYGPESGQVVGYPTPPIPPARSQSKLAWIAGSLGGALVILGVALTLVLVLGRPAEGDPPDMADKPDTGLDYDDGSIQGGNDFDDHSNAGPEFLDTAELEVAIVDTLEAEFGLPVYAECPNDIVEEPGDVFYCAAEIDGVAIEIEVLEEGDGYVTWSVLAGPEDPGPESTSQTISPETQQAMFDVCMDSTGDSGFCSCHVGEVAQTMTADELAQELEDFDKGLPTPKMDAAFEVCGAS